MKNGVLRLPRGASREARFWSKVVKKAPGECWPWLGAVNQFGYGIFHNGERNIGAHVFSYLTENEQHQPNQYILHRCDNPSCVNPAHLFAGTQRDNILDAEHKGRRRNFKRTGKTPRLFDWEVAEIKRLRQAGATFVELAAKFNAAINTIRRAATLQNHPTKPTQPN